MSRYNFNFTKAQIYNKYIITFVFSVFNAIFSFYFFRIALKDLGEESFYYYSYAKRVISFISPVLVFGLGVGLPRYMGIYYKHKRDVSILLNSALLIIFLISLIWGIINLAFNQYFTYFLWGEVNSYTLKLNIAVNCYLISLSIWSVLISYLRGNLQVFFSGFLLVISESILPFLSFSFLGSLHEIFYSISIGLFSITLVISVSFIIPSKTILRLSTIKKLLKYGFHRIPGDIAQSLIVFLPSFFAMTFFNIEYAGIISFTGAIVTLCTLPASAISFNLLSRSSYLFHSNKQHLKKELIKLIAGAIIYGLFVLIFFYFLIDIFISIFMEDSLLKHLKLIQYYLFAIPPFILFTILRSVIDGAKTKAYNSINLVISLIVLLVFIVCSVLFNSINTIIFGIIAAYLTLGLLSLIRTHLIFKE